MVWYTFTSVLKAPDTIFFYPKNGNLRSHAVRDGLLMHGISIIIIIIIIIIFMNVFIIRVQVLGNVHLNMKLFVDFPSSSKSSHVSLSSRGLLKGRQFMPICFG
jgi:hypothetical protein